METRVFRSYNTSVIREVAVPQYLDPGAGSIILQAVLAVAVGIAAGLKLYWRRLSAFFSNRSKRNGGP